MNSQITIGKKELYMPAVTIPIRAIYTAIERPIAHSIVTRLKHSSFINNDIPIIMPNEDGKIKLRNSYDTDTVNFTDSGNPERSYLYVTVENATNHDMLSATPVRGEHSPTVWKDDVINVSVRPIYTKEKFRIKIEYRSYSREGIYTWYNEMRLRIAQMADMELHTVEYIYHFPTEIYNLLKEIYTLRNESLEEIDAFVDYIMYGSRGTLTTLGDKHLEVRTLAVKEKQTRLPGRFDVDSILEKPTYDESSQRYTVEMSYIVEMDIPTSMYVKYPPSICNKLLPKKYVVPTSRPEDDDLIALHYADNNSTGLHNFDVTVQSHMSSNFRHVKLPSFDDWFIKEPIYGHAPILSGLVLVDKETPTTLLSLENDLSPLKISKAVLDWLKGGEYKYVTKLFQSLFLVTIYNNNNLLDWDYLNLDENLNLTTTKPLSETGIYHVVLWLNMDVSTIEDRLLTVLRNSPDMVLMYLQALNSAFADSTIVKEALLKRNVTKSDITSIFRYYLKNYSNADMMHIVRGRKTVQFSSVLALNID